MTEARPADLPKMVTVRVFEEPPFDWKRCDCPAPVTSRDVQLSVFHWTMSGGSWCPTVTMPGGKQMVLGPGQWR